MPRKKTEKSSQTNKSSKLKSVHIIIGITASIIILLSFFVIYKRIFPRSFPPDINEVTKLPPELQQTVKSYIPSSFKIPMLLYHYVEYVKDQGDKTRISLDIIPYIFDQQVKTLKDAGYTFMTPSQIPDLFNGKLILPTKPVILTFDDGYRDFYTDVFPILKKYNVKAVAYIVPGFLDKPNNLTHLQLKEIADSGLVEIAAHTVDHAWLKGLPEKRAEFEVIQSKKMLERELNIPIVSFAYPYGAFDLDTIKIVKQAGFETAVSTVPGDMVNKEDLYYLYRLRPGARVGKMLTSFLEASHSAKDNPF